MANYIPGWKIRLEKHDDEKNQHKYYILQVIDKYYWIAKWGRIGKTGRRQEYPKEQFSKKLHEKLNKGYETVFDDMADKTLYKFQKLIGLLENVPLTEKSQARTSKFTVKSLKSKYLTEGKKLTEQDIEKLNNIYKTWK